MLRKNAKSVDTAERKLKKYLKQFQCTGCGNQCYLDSIRCSGGEKDRKVRVEEYKKSHS